MKADETVPGRIVQDPEIMVGKPVIKGTRIPVERVIGHLARESNLNDLLAAYPELSIEDVKAALEFAHQAVSNRRWGRVRSSPRLAHRLREAPLR